MRTNNKSQGTPQIQNKNKKTQKARTHKRERENKKKSTTAHSMFLAGILPPKNNPFARKTVPEE